MVATLFVFNHSQCVTLHLLGLLFHLEILSFRLKSFTQHPHSTNLLAIISQFVYYLAGGGDVFLLSEGHFQWSTELCFYPLHSAFYRCHPYHHLDPKADHKIALHFSLCVEGVEMETETDITVK